jgi:hypothetical protein
MTGSSGHKNEISDLIKCGEFSAECIKRFCEHEKIRNANSVANYEVIA